MKCLTIIRSTCSPRMFSITITIQKVAISRVIGNKEHRQTLGMFQAFIYKLAERIMSLTYFDYLYITIIKYSLLEYSSFGTLLIEQEKAEFSYALLLGVAKELARI